MDKDHSALMGAADSGTGMEIQPYQTPANEQDAQRSSLNVNDILFILFKHKWKILLCTAFGVLASTVVYFRLPQVYESQAKLLVRYVVDRSAVDAFDSTGKTGSVQSDSLLNSEVEILTSLDLAKQVAEALGHERSGQGAVGPTGTAAAAARAIIQGLTVSVVKGTNILLVSYKDRNAERASFVLQELVSRYFEKHLEVHRSGGAFDYIKRETDQLESQLSETENALKDLKAKAGVISLSEDTAALASELAKSQEEADAAGAELAAQQARVKETEKLMARVEKKQSDDAETEVSRAVVEEYQSLAGRVTQLRQIESELLARYTPQNRFVKVKRAQLDELEKRQRDLEKKYPGLIATAAGQTVQPDLVAEKARLTAIQEKADTLKARLVTLQERSRVLSEVGPRIAQLERTKELQETNFKYYGASLEKARIDETLDPSRMPNISVVQSPSAPKASRDAGKILIGLAGGGLGLGLAIALLIELVLDRTVKRSHELETRLHIPLLLSIPYFDAQVQRLHLPDSSNGSVAALDQNESSGGSSSDPGQLLRPFCEAIRDRLGFYFEVNRMTQKPKLVAITGLSKRAGTSSLAAGLASTLAEAGEGKVLLIDKPIAPKRFYDMMAEFKKSDLDYVIFDMPSLGDTSTTLPMAGFMDKILLVVEAEKSSSDAVKRAYAQLAAKSDVSVVFNKGRSYGPKWLDGDR